MKFALTFIFAAAIFVASVSALPAQEAREPLGSDVADVEKRNRKACLTLGSSVVRSVAKGAFIARLRVQDWVIGGPLVAETSTGVSPFERFSQVTCQMRNDYPNTDTDGEFKSPADALVDVLRAFSDACNGVELLDDSEMDGLKRLLAANPTIQVTPHMLLQFVAARTDHSPDKSPRDELLHDDHLTMPPQRGRDPH
ncbi:hypothetical protein BV22DRAFT_1049517 [Leucogyrophana mollusca]|uniref:Uncharacterized protein n=1 Tax=Leucogyrophana mollusca TaxID=85980 RepID=A0ACB8B8R7_9AGAM|nr:hypothetical protein BV22DRAFT_1049517 [Leucogyrophana mollusca]